MAEIVHYHLHASLFSQSNNLVRYFTYGSSHVEHKTSLSITHRETIPYYYRKSESATRSFGLQM